MTEQYKLRMFHKPVIVNMKYARGRIDIHKVTRSKLKEILNRDLAKMNKVIIEVI